MEIASKTYLSTSAGYAILSYRTAYLKANYFLEYATAVLRSVQEDKKKLTAYASIVKDKGVEILFPDVNKSSINMDIYDFENNVIITGLVAINGMPEEMAINIIKEREANGLFTSYENFLERMCKYNLDKKSITGLVYSGALDCFDKNYSRLLSYYEYYNAYAKKVLELQADKQRSIFDFVSFEPILNYLQYTPDNNGYDLQERLSKLCEYNNVGIHSDVIKSYKNIKFDLKPSRRQEEDFDNKEGVVSGILEDEFTVSKKGKAYLSTLRTFTGDIYKLIVAKSKVEAVTDDISVYKKGMAVDIRGSFKFPKIVEHHDENGDDENTGFVNNDIVCFPNSIELKALDTPIVPMRVELNFDSMIVDKEVVVSYYGAANFNEVIKGLLSKEASDEDGKYISIIHGGNVYSANKKINITMDEIKKLGCEYKIA